MCGVVQTQTVDHRAQKNETQDDKEAAKVKTKTVNWNERKNV